ncbi:DNA-binding transcriptional regulator HexR [Roseovarius sp. THAF8]|uniref:MurR/RpiR family transcriptional regulator n=1 Tax=Roseovarius sp. THAF8 TaxID=2587846 RepID=UPI0012682CB4|nr:MurR/RpiR family transcriptional regulator [Roseovarius sp. THAF8]QFT98610.1 DNA-binding transcriptional regulator HexR [Roseovarius sp. THAF8]
MSSGFASFPQGPLGDFVGKLERELPKLPKQEAKVAQFILLNVQTIGPETGKSLAQRAGVSEITVGRLMRRLGYGGTKHLKQLLREQFTIGGPSISPSADIDSRMSQIMEAELSAVRTVFQQTDNEHWDRARRIVGSASRIYVTGFQSVRGLAEDFARRLSIARPKVQYLSPHDSMLGEWLDSDNSATKHECLVMLDVVPYANEGQALARIAKRQGRSLIVVSDEFCHWSAEIADACLYSPSNTGMFLESTLGLNATLALIVDHAANASTGEASKRLASWKKNARSLKLF